MNDKNQRLIDAMQLVMKMSARVQKRLAEGVTVSELYNEVLHVIAEAPTITPHCPICNGEMEV